MSQSDFLREVDHTLQPGQYWVRIKEDPPHRIFKPGTRFLVVKKDGAYCLCWRDGRRPAHPRILGTTIHEVYLERESDEGDRRVST